MLAGGPAGFGACVEAFTFLVGHEIVALVCDEGEDLLGGVGPSGELGEACGEEVVAFGGSSELVARRVAEEAVLALLEGESGELYEYLMILLAVTRGKKKEMSFGHLPAVKP